MLSDVELEDVKPKRKRISVAKGQLPGSHSRLKMIGENKRFKFRASACTNSKVTPFNVQEYLVSTRNARDMFFDIMSEEGCIEELLNINEVTFTPSVPDSENLTKWLERSSVKFAFRTDFSPKKKHTLSIQDSPPPTLKPETTIPIFDSKSFEFSLGKPKHDMNSLLVDAMTKSPKLISNKNVFEALDEISKSAESRKQKIQAFFCGGPILSIKPALLCTSDGYQVVAVTTAADEATWQHQPGMPSYIQFWKFNGLSTMDNPSIWFLLRIENIGTISHMCWCPFFHEKILIDEAKNSKILGYLAITTDVGKILIFKINKEIDLPSDNPPVVISTPVFVFEHPTVGIPHEIKIEDESFIDENSNDVPSELDNSAINESIASSSATTPKPRRSKRSTRNMKKIIEEPDDAEIIDGEDVEMENAEEAKEKEETEKPQENVEMEVVEEKENVAKERKMENTEVDEAPFICVDWSPFSRCKDIVAISATGWIIFFDLTEGMEAKDALYDISWESPPLSAKWISNNTIAVGFSSRIIIYYDVNTKERIFEDNTSRSVGTMVATQPVLFPGAFSYDAVRVIPEDNQKQQD
uniref:Uncharacterized protein n=1 Tax=Panagrolaimus davidi TaxID=227884 RepID=A0A914P2I6_9BILA